MSIQYNKFTTVTSCEFAGKQIFFPFIPYGEKFRGGAFWCIPNLGPKDTFFTLQNGEYRNQEGSFKKMLSGAWGRLEADVTWEEAGSVIHTKATIKALERHTHIRPGFHPYFATGKQFILTTDSLTLTQESIEHDAIRIIPHASSLTLDGEHGKVVISFTTKTSSSSLSHVYGFCIWTDKKDSYICIEPVVGKTFIGNTLPEPLTLENNDTLTLEVVVSSFLS